VNASRWRASSDSADQGGKAEGHRHTYDTRITAYKDIPKTKEAGLPRVK